MVIYEKENIYVIAQENEIAPNQVHNWKREFLENASLVFDNKKDKEYKEKAAMQEQETDRLYKTIGQLTVLLQKFHQVKLIPLLHKS